MKVTGIGGIFFASQNPTELKSWYAKHLGIASWFFAHDMNEPNGVVYTAWSPLPASDKLFKPSNKSFVINYRVDDIKGLVASLVKNSVVITSEEEHKEGMFAHLLDPEGNKVILWQPTSFVPPSDTNASEKVTGLGGVFFKGADNKKLNEWYAANLGLNITQWGCQFEWIDPKNQGAKAPASTSWSIFAASTAYLDPSKKDFMFNYRVKDLHALMASLKAEHVEIVGKIDEQPYGKFGWIMDPEGNKIELWEPVDDGF